MDAQLRAVYDKYDPVYRSIYEKRLTIGHAPYPGGCCGLFDLCGDADLISLSMMAQEPFLDWLGWEKSDVCEVRKNFITWVRPDTGSSRGYLADPCAESEGVSFGTCDFLLEGFGRLRRHSPVRDQTKVGLRLCENQPRYRLDGKPIGDENEWDIRLVTEGIMQDFRNLIITGNHAVGVDDGLWDGLRQLVNTGYVNTHGERCCMMDSIVVDWNGNALCDKTTAGHGTTWNGVPLATGFDFIEVLLAVYRRIRQRLHMSPTLAGNLTPGDMVFVGTTSLNQCLLDCYTCWSLCVNSFTETREARMFRDSLNGGMFGAGTIKLDGFEIPLVNYDWSMINSGTLSDGYLLVNKVGAQRLLQGQYNDLSRNVSKIPDSEYSDGGRLLIMTEHDKTCVLHDVEFQPRLLAWAPWSQARFLDLRCSAPGGPLSPDPWSLSFYPECSFRAETCPDLYDGVSRQ